MSSSNELEAQQETGVGLRTQHDSRRDELPPIAAKMQHLHSSQRLAKRTTWTREHILTEIRRLHRQGAVLRYTLTERQYPALMRAATRHFGTWRRAVEEAGVDYDTVRKYQRWDRERIVNRIRELHAAGHDLSWRMVSLEVDPPLAFAAITPKGFGSWRAAITAAGLNYEEVARYKYWNKKRVIQEIQELQRAGKPLCVSDVKRSNLPLLWAARRRFTSWNNALIEAGIDPATVHLRSSAPSAKKT